MTRTFAVQSALSKSVVRSSASLDIPAYQSPHCSAVIWERPQNSDIRHFAQALLPHMPRSLKALIRASAAEDIAALLAPWQSLHPLGYRALCRDITTLSQLYQQANGAQSLEIQLQRVENDMCSRFHADSNHSRLLCTYVGAGSLWTPDDNVVWSSDLEKALVMGLKDSEAYAQVQAFDVFMMKGRRHPDMKSRGQVHRSPPISAEMERRLLLKIENV